MYGSTKHPSEYFYCFTTLSPNSADPKPGHKSGELRDKKQVPVLAVKSDLGKVLGPHNIRLWSVVDLVSNKNLLQKLLQIAIELLMGFCV